MINIKNSYYLVLPLALLTVSCGSKDDKEDSPKTVYGTMVLSESKGGDDNATVSLTSVNTCKRNADTGRVDIKISAGNGKPSLTLAIKDFSSEAKTYSCTQAADNVASETDLGGKFETCAVTASVLSAPKSTTLNTYSMYRESTATKPFQSVYTGACSISVTKGSPSIAGTVTCTGLLQTTLEGAPRNPIKNTITASVKSDFQCSY